MSADASATDPDGPELIGYASRFSVAPTEALSFMVSGEVERAEARLVRLVHGDERSPLGLVEREVASSLDGSWSLERQPVHAGSFGLVEPSAALAAASADRISGHVLLFPTLVGSGQLQGVLAHARADGRPGWALALEAGGDLVLRVLEGEGDRGRDRTTRLDRALRERAWHSISFAIDRTAGRMEVWCTPLAGPAFGVTLHAQAALGGEIGPACDGPLLLAAERLLPARGEPRAAGAFNGKLQRPILLAGRLDHADVAQLAAGIEPQRLAAPVVLDLDLGARSDGWELVDRSPFGHRGRVYNAPLRRCTSHGWRGGAIAPELAPADFAAIHFHDDDVHHANWQPTCEWTVPADLPSGLYAVRLRGAGAEDRVPFIVRPPRGRATAPVALWLPTFTYAAYANARRCLVGKPSGIHRPEQPAGDRLLSRHPEWGSSAYDLHSDGSGVALSSLARPVPNLRPTYRPGLVNAPRHLAADLYLIHWLEHGGVAFDVVGDEDVHAEGCELLRRYRTVITGSHPEYVTGRELDAVEQYTDRGGRLMYMGGNGFYWVTTVAPEDAVTIEVRRGRAGTRTWESSPGEEHHQLTGEPGGLWRYRGRPPHALVGVGFVAEGWDGENRPYHRSPASFEPHASWAFTGIGDDEAIGDRGLVMGGAAGDELDSVDHARGTPLETIVLASSSGHGEAFLLVIEDMLENADGLSGPRDARVRADVALTPTRNGGAVFAAGSISWTGCLSQHGYDNPVARLCGNVLRAFSSGASPWRAGAAADVSPTEARSAASRSGSRGPGRARRD